MLLKGVSSWIAMDRNWGMDVWKTRTLLWFAMKENAYRLDKLLRRLNGTISANSHP